MSQFWKRWSRPLIVLGRGGGCLLLVAGVIGGWRTGPALGAGTFTVSARADVASLELVDTQAPAVPGGQVLFLTPGTAQALLDSLGTSAAFASAPYPGDVIATLPGTINGLAAESGLPAVPDYPLIVSSSHPTRPDDARQAGVFDLSAHSKDSDSVATARSGLLAGDPALGSGTAHAHSAVDGGGTAVAEALSRIDAVSVGDGALRLTGITASAKLTAEPGKPVKKESSLSVASVSVAGTPVELTEKGLTVKGSPVLPAPDASALRQALTQAGIDLAYVPGEQTETAVRSASLRIAFTVSPPGSAPAKVTLVLGQVSASATSATEPGLADDPGGHFAFSSPTEPAGSPASDGGLLAAVPVADASAGLPGSALTAGADLGSGSDPGAGSTSAGGVAPEAALSPAGAPAGSPITAPAPKRLYLVLVVAGLAAVAGSRIMAGFRLRLVKELP